MKNTFSENERACERVFDCGGKYWHAYTDGQTTQIMFKNTEDYTFAMNVIAQAANEYSEIKLIAFTVMSNHFHFVISTVQDNYIRDFYTFIRRRISRSIPEIRRTRLSLKPIDNLKSLRNNIVYTNRNGYVADPGHTPFSYPWGTGRHYFNSVPYFQKISDFHTDARRIMFRGRAPHLPENWGMAEGYISPPSFCDIVFGMELFRNAHQYFSMVSKNVEAYSGVAAEIDDSEFLTDTELFAQVNIILKSDFGQSSLRDLSKAQKLDLARSLHYDYRSSNGQIHRVIGIPMNIINNLFPLSTKHK